MARRAEKQTGESEMNREQHRPAVISNEVRIGPSQSYVGVSVSKAENGPFFLTLCDTDLWIIIKVSALDFVDRRVVTKLQGTDRRSKEGSPLNDGGKEKTRVECAACSIN